MSLDLIPVYINGTRHLLPKNKNISFTDAILLSGRDLLDSRNSLVYDSVKFKHNYHKVDSGWNDLTLDMEVSPSSGMQISVKTKNKNEV